LPRTKGRLTPSVRRLDTRLLLSLGVLVVLLPVFPVLEVEELTVLARCVALQDFPIPL